MVIYINWYCIFLDFEISVWYCKWLQRQIRKIIKHELIVLHEFLLLWLFLVCYFYCRYKRTEIFRKVVQWHGNLVILLGYLKIIPIYIRSDSDKTWRENLRFCWHYFQSIGICFVIWLILIIKETLDNLLECASKCILHMQVLRNCSCPRDLNGSRIAYNIVRPHAM